MQYEDLGQKQQDIDEQIKEIERKREQICGFAEKRIMPKYCFKFYVAPAIISLLTLAFIIFIGLQFFFFEKEWNFAVSFFDWVKETTFGHLVGDYVYTIDIAFGGAVWFLLNKRMENPFNKAKKEQAKSNMVQKYIKDHNLD